MIKKLILSFTLIAAALNSEAQSNTATEKPLPVEATKKNPLFFADSVMVSRTELQLININDIASFTVIKEKEKIEKAGYKGEVGLVYLETQSFAKKRYQRFLSSKSSEYAELLSKNQGEDGLVYVLNEEVLGKSLNRRLAEITTESFIELKIVKAEDLPSKYKESNPKFGVVIKAAPIKRVVI